MFRRHERERSAGRKDVDRVRTGRSADQLARRCNHATRTSGQSCVTFLFEVGSHAPGQQEPPRTPVVVDGSLDRYEQFPESPATRRARSVLQGAPVLRRDPLRTPLPLLDDRDERRSRRVDEQSWSCRRPEDPPEGSPDARACRPPVPRRRSAGCSSTSRQSTQMDQACIPLQTTCPSPEWNSSHPTGIRFIGLTAGVAQRALGTLCPFPCGPTRSLTARLDAAR